MAAQERCACESRFVCIGRTAPDEIVFATSYSPIAQAGGFVRSHLRVLRHDASSNRLMLVGGPATVPIGETQFPSNTDFLGYGACGIAVADLPMPGGLSDLPLAIVVTTLNGEIAVFKHTNGVLDPNPVYRTIVAGSVGAYNSIVIEDLDPANSLPEMYVAGSSGIRRFDFGGQQ